jgi:hypothetical protein
VPAKIRHGKDRIEELDDVTRQYFMDEITEGQACDLLKPHTQYDDSERWYRFARMNWITPPPGTSEAEVWARWRDELLAEFIEKHPGCRPAAWWIHDAECPQDADGRRLHPEDGESQPQFLFNHGLLTEDELPLFTEIESESEGEKNETDN